MYIDEAEYRPCPKFLEIQISRIPFKKDVKLYTKKRMRASYFAYEARRIIETALT